MKNNTQQFKALTIHSNFWLKNWNPPKSLNFWICSNNLLKELARLLTIVSIFIGIVAVISFGFSAINFVSTLFLGTYLDHDFNNDLPSDKSHKLKLSFCKAWLTMNNTNILVRGGSSTFLHFQVGFQFLFGALSLLKPKLGLLLLPQKITREWILPLPRLSFWDFY